MVIAVELFRTTRAVACEALAVPLRSCCEGLAKRSCREACCDALAMPSRRRHETAARLLRNGSKVITVLLRSCCEAVENVAEPLRRYHEVAKMFDAVAMLLRSRYKAAGRLVAKLIPRLCRCGDAVSCMQSHSYGCKL